MGRKITIDSATLFNKALEMIEEELRSRGVGAAEIDAHAAEHGAKVLLDSEGIAQLCSFCHDPAVAEGWGWHYLWGRVPVFPRFFRYCPKDQPPEQHRERALDDEREPDGEPGA